MPRQRGRLQRADVAGRRAHPKSEKIQGVRNEATKQESQTTRAWGSHGRVPSLGQEGVEKMTRSDSRSEKVTLTATEEWTRKRKVVESGNIRGLTAGMIQEWNGLSLFLAPWRLLDQSILRESATSSPVSSWTLQVWLPYHTD